MPRDGLQTSLRYAQHSLFSIKFFVFDGFSIDIMRSRTTFRARHSKFQEHIILSIQAEQKLGLNANGKGCAVEHVGGAFESHRTRSNAVPPFVQR